MIGHWFQRRTAPADPATIQPLDLADVGALALGQSSSFTPYRLREHLQVCPKRSFWIPETGEYIIGGNWRHREEFGSIVDLGVRGQNRGPLIDALAAACAAQQCPLVVFADGGEARSPRWYDEVGFEQIQEVVVYELQGLPAVARPLVTSLAFERVTEDDDLGVVAALDHRCFPYLWWNGEREFYQYLTGDHVQIHLGRAAGGEVVAYAGVSFYSGWGHLDRLAVAPEWQGRGLGLETLAYVTDRVHATGARRLELSTQADNMVSRRLYERYGFRRTYRSDYLIYGRWLTGDRAERRRMLVTPGQG